MNIILVTLLCAVAFGNPLDENKRLKRSNSVLLQALKELTQSEAAKEEAVGACYNYDAMVVSILKYASNFGVTNCDSAVALGESNGATCDDFVNIFKTIGLIDMSVDKTLTEICCESCGVKESSVGWHDGFRYTSVMDGLKSEYGGVEGCNCDGGRANSNGRGGSDCSASGNSNGKPWCYVGADSTCTDLKGSSDKPWSEQACANPSQCTEWENGMCDASIRDDVYTADSFLFQGANTARTKDECHQWCAMKQTAGCCMWGKPTAASYEQDVCSFARGIMKEKAGGQRHHMNTINKHSICT